jgi:hypothetical protein
VVVVSQPLGHVKARLLAQSDIDQHDIRAEGFGPLYRLGASTGGPGHDYPVSLEHGMRHRDERFIVVDYYTP